MSVRIKALSAIHREIYAASGGRLGRRIAGMPVLLLTTLGKRSGRPREVPLTYIEDGGTLVLVASYGGRAHNPAWFENLRANPSVEVATGGDRRPMRARPATTEERARLWPIVIATYDGYAKYHAKTTREIPLAILEEA
jgi:deazaflavin-dependent oxidoreductase (nitroreductase family)